MGISTFAYGFLDYDNAYYAPEINELLRDLNDMGQQWGDKIERNLLVDTFIRQEYDTKLVDLSDETNIGWFVHAPADVWLHSRASGGFKVFFSSEEMLEYVVSGSKELCECDPRPFGKIERIPQDQTPGQTLYKTEEGTKHFNDIVERVVNENVYGRDFCYLSLKEKDGTGVVAFKSEDCWTVCAIYAENGRSPSLGGIDINTDKEAVSLLLQIHIRDILQD